jgi:hypothetical protein
VTIFLVSAARFGWDEILHRCRHCLPRRPPRTSRPVGWPPPTPLGESAREARPETIARVLSEWWRLSGRVSRMGYQILQLLPVVRLIVTNETVDLNGT